VCVKHDLLIFANYFYKLFNDVFKIGRVTSFFALYGFIHPLCMQPCSNYRYIPHHRSLVLLAMLFLGKVACEARIYSQFAMGSALVANDKIQLL